MNTRKCVDAVQALNQTLLMIIEWVWLILIKRESVFKMSVTVLCVSSHIVFLCGESVSVDVNAL